MARQMLQQKYKEELKHAFDKVNDKKQDLKQIKKSNSNLGMSRLGAILTTRMFLRDIKNSNKFAKIEKQTLNKLTNKIDS